MAYMAGVAPAAGTLASGCLWGAGCVYALTGLAYAEDKQFSDATVNLDEESIQPADNLEFSFTGAQAATLGTTIRATNMTIDGGTDLTLSGDGTLTLTGELAVLGSLRLETEALLNIAATNMSGNGRLTLAYAKDTALTATTVNSGFTGTLEIAAGNYTLSPEDAAALKFSSIWVTRAYFVSDPENEDSSIGGSLLLDSGEYNIPLSICGGFRNGETAIQAKGGTILNGSLTLRDGAVFNITDSSEKNPMVINGNIDLGGNAFRIWNNQVTGYMAWNGTVSNLGEIQLANSSALYINMPISPDVMADNSTTLSLSTGGGSAGGYVYLKEGASGFTTFNVGGGEIHIEKEFVGAGGTMTKSGGGALYFDGPVSGIERFEASAGTIYITDSISGLKSMNVNGAVVISGIIYADDLVISQRLPANTNRVTFSGDLVGDGTIKLDAWGDVLFTGEGISHTGILEFTGRVKWGAHETSTTTLAFSEIRIGISTSTFYIQHAPGETGQKVTLGGGTIQMFDMTDGVSWMAFPELEVTTDSHLVFTWNGGLRFATLTGSGSMDVKKEQGSGQESIFYIDEAHNYSGSLTWLNGDNHAYHTIRLDAVNQEHGETMTIGSADAGMNMDLDSDSFLMKGNGTLVVYGDHVSNGTFQVMSGTYDNKYGSVRTEDIFVVSGGTVSIAKDLTTEGGFALENGILNIGANMNVGGDFWFASNGTLNLTGNVTLANDAGLRYASHDDSVTTDYLDVLTEAGRVTVDGESRLWVFSNDFDPAELMSEKGVDLLINTTDVDSSQLFALGYSSEEYEIVANEETGTWWLRASCAPHAEAESTDGIWDPAWGTELRARPISGDMHVYDLAHSIAYDARLADNEYYRGRSTTGPVYWAEFRSGSMNYNLVGGTKNTHAVDVHASSWMLVTASSYRNIVGGNHAQEWASGRPKIAFEGDSHIMIKGSDTAVLVHNVIGGNYGDANGSGFHGSSWISIDDNVRVYGFVVGGSVVMHNSTRDLFTGDSHVYIYTPLEKTSMWNPVDTDASSANAYAPQAVIGGNLWYSNTNCPEFGGSSSITVDLRNRNAGKEFSKLIVGGDYATNRSLLTGAGVYNVLKHGGDSIVGIQRANGVTFTEMIIGGSYANVMAPIEMLGDSKVTISGSGAKFNNVVVAGALSHSVGVTLVQNNTETHIAGGVKIAGDTVLEIEGGTFNGMESGVAGLGKLGLVGGSLVLNEYESEAVAGQVSIGGDSSVSLSHASVSGWVVGSSALISSKDAATGGVWTDGASAVKVADSTLSTGIVGGLLVAQPSSVLVGDEAHFSTGDVSVSVSSSTVGRIIGGSWVQGLQLQDQVVEQGDISLSLTGSSTVRGDVFAAGLQGSEIGMSAQDTEVSLTSSVRFAKADGSDAVVSGGFLSTKGGAPDSAYGSYYDGVDAVVLGASTLRLTDGRSYGDNLSKVRLLNFDRVELAEGADVTVRALVVADGRSDADPEAVTTRGITLSGAGTLALDGALMSAVDATTGGSKNIRSNSAMTLSDGVTLHLLNSSASNHLSFVEKIVAEEGTRVVLDLGRTGEGNDTLHVFDGIEMLGDSELTINFNGTASMKRNALIREQGHASLSAAHGKENVLRLHDTHVNLNIGYLETALLTGEDVELIVAESVSGDFVPNAELAQSLRKWFSGDARAEIVEREKRQLVLRGTTVSSDTADYHSSNALTENGLVGARLLDNLYTTVNPEATDASGDRTALLKAMEVHFGNNETEKADRIMAAAAGSSLPALGMAFGDDVDRQLRAMRNRSTSAGLDADYDYGELPRYQMWINAEGDMHKTKAESTMAGYRMNSWGGTVGLAADVSEKTSLGLAITAMYGALDVDAPDKLKGHLSTTYLSGYARHVSGTWSHTLVAAVGMADVNATRTVDYELGRYSAKSNTTGFGVGVMYEMGYSILLNESGSACVQPVVNITWRHAQLGGYSENGSDAGLEVEAIKNESLAVGAGVRVQALTGGELYNRTSLAEGRLLFKGYTGDKSVGADVSFNGATRSGRVKSAEVGSFGLEIGAGLSIPMSTEMTSSVFMDVSAELRSAYTNFNATVGWKTNF